MAYVHNPVPQHNCFCEVVSSFNKITLTDMRLHGTMDLKVEEDIRIRVPLANDCDCHPVRPAQQAGYHVQKRESYRERVVVRSRSSSPERVVVTTTKPAVIRTEKVESGVRRSNSRSGSVVIGRHGSGASSASTFVTKQHVAAQKIMVTISVKDLPKMDIGGFGGCDPYYKFILDGKVIAGGDHQTVKNKREGSWSFKIGAVVFNNAKKIKLEFWDKDVMTDEYIGAYELGVKEFLEKRSFRNTTFPTTKKGKKPVRLDLTWSYQI